MFNSICLKVLVLLDNDYVKMFPVTQVFLSVFVVDLSHPFLAITFSLGLFPEFEKLYHPYICTSNVYGFAILHT